MFLLHQAVDKLTVLVVILNTALHLTEDAHPKGAVARLFERYLERSAVSVLGFFSFKWLSISSPRC
jgi:hypothetical protein